jgi:SAM-dependent methyltransferase
MAGPVSETSPHVRKNRTHWEAQSRNYQDWNRSQLDRWDELGWGVWNIPEDEVKVLGDVTGLDALEFGCGACQFGIKVAMRGARVRGLDFSHPQLVQGLANMETTGVRFPLVQADGERVPFADASFDLVFADHGVMGFADPYRTVPQVARVLRRSGRFVFSMPTPIIWMAWGVEAGDPGRELRMPYFDIRSLDSDDPQWITTEFQLTYGGWIRLFAATGLIPEDLLELRPAEGSTTTYDTYASLEWARDFPGDHIWVLRKG